MLDAPVRGSDHAASYDMVTCRDFIVEPGEPVLVATWLCRLQEGIAAGLRLESRWGRIWVEVSSTRITVAR